MTVPMPDSPETGPSETWTGPSGTDPKGTVLVWITESTWPACVDAARERAPHDAVVLLHVSDDEVAAAHHAYEGLLGRGHRPERDPGARLEALSGTAAADLLEAAAHRLGRPCELLDHHGRAEHEVVRAAADAALLICARDGERGHPGPHSLGRATRFVVDHAECPVLLVWP
ncbi:Nucleotide-binding universal stress protein, UspA family [Streptomyces sp. MnatMP-M17]|nr:Nucleotide-binding universal stress protein, UspA family [Streptomyces sp. MnatMP-M17]